MKKMELTDIYKGVLAVAGLTADSEGFISIELTKANKTEALVKGKRLVMPINSQLSSDMTNRISFHPLNETIARGESDVMAFYRECVNKRFNFIIGYLAISLLVIATSEAEHKTLAPDQTIFMDRLKEVDPGTLDRMIAITKAMSVGDASRSFVNFYVKKFGEVKGEKFNRVGVVSFPYYTELCKVPDKGDKNEIYGVKLRKTDRAALIGLIEYILPNIADPKSYYRGSNSEIAPTLDSLLRTAVAVGDSINNILDIFGDKIEGHEDLRISGEWEEPFNSLPMYLPQIRMVPPQPGNEGNIPRKGADAPTLSVSDSVVAARNDAPARIVPPRSMGVEVEGKPTPTLEPEVVQPAHVYGSLNQQVTNYPVAASYQQQQPVRAPVPGERVDFMAQLAQNPALAAQVGAGGYNRGFAGNNTGRREPSFGGFVNTGGGMGGGYNTNPGYGGGGYGGGGYNRDI